MAISTKILKSRIKSIQNTMKITKAMELVAATKMRKAVNQVLASRSYSDLAWDILTRIKSKTNSKWHPLLNDIKQPKRVLLVVISSNRGLCGGYNTQLSREVTRYIRAREESTFELALVGKKARSLLSIFGDHIIADFIKEDVITQINEIFSLSHFILDDFTKLKYDAVVVAYTDFISSLKQIPRLRQLLPIQGKDEYLGEIDTKQSTFKSQMKKNGSEYLFEPDAERVLNQLLPRLIEIQLYQAYLEANASEHAARMMAMRSASDAASDLIFDLQLNFNQARQAAITREIAEISAGKAVLE